MNNYLIEFNKSKSTDKKEIVMKASNELMILNQHWTEKKVRKYFNDNLNRCRSLLDQPKQLMAPSHQNIKSTMPLGESNHQPPKSFKELFSYKSCSSSLLDAQRKMIQHRNKTSESDTESSILKLVKSSPNYNTIIYEAFLQFPPKSTHQEEISESNAGSQNADNEQELQKTEVDSESHIEHNEQELQKPKVGLKPLIEVDPKSNIEHNEQELQESNGVQNDSSDQSNTQEGEEEVLQEYEEEEEEDEEPILLDTLKDCISNSKLSMDFNKPLNKEEVKNKVGIHYQSDDFSKRIAFDKHHTHLLEKDLATKRQLFHGYEALDFLAGIDCTNYDIKSYTKLNRDFVVQTNEKDTEKIIFHRRIDVLHKDKVFLKVYYTADASFFVFQVLIGGYLNMKRVLFAPRNKHGRNTYGYIFIPLENNAPRVPWNPLGYRENKIIRAISQYICRYPNIKKVNYGTAYLFLNVSPPISFRSCLKRTPYVQNIPENIQSLEQIFDETKGFTLLIPNSDGNFSYKNIKIGAFIYIPYSTFELLQMDESVLSCIELDTSFKPTSPDVYCVPQLIYRNVGIPIALIVGPSESCELYNLLYFAIQHYDKLNHTTLSSTVEKIPILTDMHPSFTSLSSKYKMEHYYCFAHIIRSYGANSIISLFVRDVLFSHSKNQYEKNIAKNAELFDILGQSVHNIKNFDTSFKSFKEKIISFDDQAPTYNKCFSPLYYRMTKHIPTTTNHCERFHKNINRAVRERMQEYNRHLRIAIIVRIMQANIESVNARLKRQIQEHIRQRKNFANGHFTPDSKYFVLPDQYDKTFFKKPKCNDDYCFDKKYTTYKFGENNNIPCFHCILNKDIQGKKASDFFTKLVIPPTKKQPYVEILNETDYVIKKFSDKNTEENVSFLTMNPLNISDFKNPITAMIARTYLALRTVLKNKINFFTVCDYCNIFLFRFLTCPDHKTWLDMYKNSTDTFINYLTIAIIIQAFRDNHKEF